MAMCVLCREHTRACLFLPCRHLLYCWHCGVSFKKCSHCQAEIRGRLHVQMTRRLPLWVCMWKGMTKDLYGHKAICKMDFHVDWMSNKWNLFYRYSSKGARQQQTRSDDLYSGQQFFFSKITCFPLLL